MLWLPIAFSILPVLAYLHQQDISASILEGHATMEFMTHSRLAASFRLLNDEARVELMSRERDYASALRVGGKIARLWRDPCRMAHWILWNVSDAGELHTLMTGLPAYVHFDDVKVIPLCAHPLDFGPEET
jgi:muconolactone D-isomerase